VTDNLAAKYPTAVPGKFNIGMLHTSASSAGNLHAPYAPCTVEQLVAKRYDYWALGHVHQRAILHEDPYVVFPGNIQGRHIREPAEEGKGATLVEVTHGAITDVRHVTLDTVRWQQINVSANGLATAEDVITLIQAQVQKASDACPNCLLAARIVITGECTATLAIQKDTASFDSSVRAYVQDRTEGVWLEDILVRTTFPNLTSASSDQGALSELLEYIRTSAGRLKEPQKRLATLVTKLEPVAPGLLPELGLDDPGLLESLLVEAETLILSLATEAGS
jgi:DNA repair exonuclease SbcCD nuclease subunit